LVPFKDSCEVGRKQTVPVREIEEDAQRMKVGVDVGLSSAHGLPEPFKPPVVKAVLNIVSRDETCLDLSLFEPLGDHIGGYLFEKVGIRSEV
jgi:hypothetical protein